MPRGVPRNRVAAPRVSPAPEVAEPPVAVETVGEPDRAEPAPAPDPAPTPTEELTPDQRMIRELQNQLALERGKKDGELQYDVLAQPGSADNILIHFLEDGLTAQGTIWYRGQELEFEVGSQAYKDTFDRLGRSWLSLVDDEPAQAERGGKVMFRRGPWPGRKLAESKVTFQRVADESGRPLPVPSQDELAKADAAEAKRRRAAPRLQSI